LPVDPPTTLAPEVAHKLDGGLLRLMTMEADAVHRAVLNDHRRLYRRKVSAKLRERALAPDAVRPRPPVDDHPLWAFVGLYRTKLRRIRVRAIVRFGGNRRDLEDLGIQVRSQAHDIFTIQGTPAELRTLAEQPATLSLRLPRLLLPTVGDASAQAEIANVHQPRPANPTGYRGAGVVVGIVDTPLDVRHPTFRNAAAPNGSRVLFYWVQNPDLAAAPGQTPQGFNNVAFNGLNYGRIYTTAAINAALGNAAGTYGNGNNQISKALSATVSEHGTHTAGIAVGNGHTAAYAVGPNVGAAPAAALVHVDIWSTWAGLSGTAYEDNLIDAIDFVFRAAALNNQPAVVSVSLGTNLGPHDGHTLFDQDRDNLINSFVNRSVVFSAGNDNNDSGYRRETVNAGVTTSFTFTPTTAAPTITNVFLDIWYTGPQLDVEFLRGASTTGWVTAGNTFSGAVSTSTVAISRDPETSSGTRGLRLYVQSTNAGHVWTVRLRNPHASDAVSYHAWAGIQGQHASLSGSIQNERTIGDTGCGKAILTIGSCGKVLPANPATGEVTATYSGAGPTLDGRVKPELTAVGGIFGDIQSANSLVLNGYVGMNGTSMSTPLVAGLVALIMEERTLAGATIDQDTIKALLIRHANRTNLNLDPNLPGYVATQRNVYGHGRVRAIGPLDHHLPPQDVDVWVRTAPDDYGLEPFIGDVYWVAPEITVRPQGSSVATTTLQWGQVYDVTVRVRNLGDNAAVGTDVWLKYSRPWAAPNNWAAAEDTSNVALHQSVTVPALGFIDVVFAWRPDSGEIPPPYPDAHFCILVEVSHVNDVLAYPSPSGGGSAWDSNIRGTNNIALRNVSIQ
jgi:subtilisin family serine protease